MILVTREPMHVEPVCCLRRKERGPRTGRPNLPTAVAVTSMCAQKVGKRQKALSLSLDEDRLRVEQSDR